MAAAQFRVHFTAFNSTCARITADGSWFPNLLNTKQKPHFEFEDSRLVLKADTEWGRVQIIWERFDAGLHSQ
jgi:hypothetical protein